VAGSPQTCYAAEANEQVSGLVQKTISLPSGPGPLDNPLKGWCTYTFPGELHQPYSLVYQYVSWKQLEPVKGDYEFARWEKKAWDGPLSVDRHIVFRVYLDYPGTPAGIPDWVAADGLKTRHYTDYGGGNSPDYDNPNLVAGLVKLIAALGKRYDHNSRVAFVELGTLGFWGEWHTYPHVSWFASAATQQRIVDAYHQAFPDKILLGRYADGVLGTEDWLGYHDDFFPSDTNGSEDWMFLPKMRKSGRTENWRRAAIGGEMEPNAANKWLGDGFSTTMDALKSGHFSWIGPYNPGMERNESATFISRSQEMVRTMGYQYRLKSLSFAPVVRKSRSLKIDIVAENDGVAPFYYPWKVQIAILTLSGSVAAIIPLPDDIRTWQPGPFSIHAVATEKLRPGSYQLALGILDPYTGHPDLQFANKLKYVSGWTVLSKLRIIP
jgi:hypothetical protein